MVSSAKCPLLKWNTRSLHAYSIYFILLSPLKYLLKFFQVEVWPHPTAVQTNWVLPILRARAAEYNVPLRVSCQKLLHGVQPILLGLLRWVWVLYLCSSLFSLIWCAGWESNPLPIVLEATALTLWATSAVYYFNTAIMKAAQATNIAPPKTTDNKSIAVSIVVPCV